MDWKLFLDDDADGSRRPAISVENPSWRARMGLPLTPPDTWSLGDWVIARSYDEAVAAFAERGMPVFASFDHDLGDGKDGMSVVRFMIEHDLDHASLPREFAYEVHSANPVGRENIARLLESYLGARSRTP